MRSAIVLAVVGLLGATSVTARADEAPATLSLNDALSRAEGAPSARLAAVQVDVTAAEVGVAGIFPNPRVSLGTTTATALVTAGVTVFLPVFGQVGLAKDAARAQVSTRAEAARVALADAKLAAALAWIDLWLAERERDVARDEAVRSARVVDVARAREAEGSAPRLDVLRSEAERARADAEATATKQLVGAAEARLALALGEDAATHHYATTGSPFGEADRPPAANDPAAVRAHPLVRTARASVAESDAVLARMRRARFPLLALQVWGNVLKRQAPENDLQFTLTFDIPLFDGPLVTRADTQRALAQVGATSAELDVAARIAAARAEADAAITRTHALTDAVAPAQDEAAALALEGYEHGATDLTAVLAARQAVAQTRLLVVRAEADRGRAIARLRWAAGTP
jgi:outer membrane protein TolC